MQRRPFFVIVVCLFIIQLFGNSSLAVVPVLDNAYYSLAQTYVDHDFIAILGNDDFLTQTSSEGWSGSGTAEDPIIISEYRIQMSRHLFRVVNTDLHFIFTDNYLDGVDGAWCGLYLANVTNGVITNTIVRNSAIAFHMIEIYNCTLTNNELNDNYNEGITLELACIGNNLTDNQIYDNAESGILLDFGCEGNLVAQNDIYDNGGNGVYIWPDSSTLSANNNWITNNTITRHSVGISIQGHENFVSGNTIINSYSSGILCGGKDNAITDNEVRDGRRDGIKLYSYASGIFVGSNSIQNNTDLGIKISSTCDNNTVMFNDFIENNVTCQAWDDGENNLFLDNYYSSWNAPDENSDGSVDLGYPIGGDAVSIDSMPSTQPNRDTPIWYTYIQVSGTSSTETVQSDFDFQIRMLVVVAAVAIGIAMLGLRGRRIR
ncbi:MAG: right-handed parallel beta-helix repeat-containing protein [Candidatus Thorarchaeota archaeon]|nr:right-handed parallel beta-helix repeat-containing protein [Candidatus Thorarchaeota archaeon]